MESGKGERGGGRKGGKREGSAGADTFLCGLRSLTKIQVFNSKRYRISFQYTSVFLYYSTEDIRTERNLCVVSCCGVLTVQLARPRVGLSVCMWVFVCLAEEYYRGARHNNYHSYL